MGPFVNFSAVRPQTVLGRMLRFVAYRLVPPGLPLPILQGPAAGKRWLAGAHVPACWLGCYEAQKQALMAQTIRPGSIVADVGAHRGYFTLVASALAGPAGRVYAFEPLPLNITYLSRHLKLNRVDNVAILPVALSDQSGKVRFEDETRFSNRVGGHLSADGALEVEARTLDELCGEGQVAPPHLIKIDVEGAEMLVLRGARETLARHHPALFIDTHNRALHNECVDFLQSLGYQTQLIHEQVKTVYDGTEWHHSDLAATAPAAASA